MKLSTVAKKSGYLFCVLGAFSAVFLFWQLVAYNSSPVPVTLGVLFYSNLACVIVLPLIGRHLLRRSVTLMLQCR